MILLDTMIAAHALSQQALLVTNNIREFAKVPGLQDTPACISQLTLSELAGI